MQSGIPARIIQTGRSHDLPLLAKAAAANLQCLNPDFEYLFFDDAAVISFIEKEFPQYLETFEAFPFRIQRIDFFRYLAVFRLGGFYFDLDVFLSEPISGLLCHQAIFPFEELTLSRFLRERGLDWEIGNYAFGAVAGHPFLDAVIDNCVRAQKDAEWVKPMMQGIPRLFRAEFQVLNTTGPGMLSRTLAESPERAKDLTILFPDDVCDERTWHQFGNFGIHLMQASWRSQGGYIRRRLANRWESWIRRRLMRESLAVGKSRSIPLQSSLRAAASA